MWIVGGRARGCVPNARKITRRSLGAPELYSYTTYTVYRPRNGPGFCVGARSDKRIIHIRFVDAPNTLVLDFSVIERIVLYYVVILVKLTQTCFLRVLSTINTHMLVCSIANSSFAIALHFLGVVDNEII